MKNLWLFRKYFWAYKERLALLICLILSGALFEGVGIGLFFPLIEYVQKGESVLSDGKFKNLFVGMKFIGLTPTIGNLALIIFFVIVAALVLRYCIHTISARTYNPIMKQICDDGFKKVINSSMQYFHTISSGKLVNTFMKEVENVGQSINFLIQLGASLSYIIVYTFAILFISWKLTLIVGCIALVRFKVLGLFLKVMRKAGKENINIRANISTYLVGVYQGIDVIKSYATEERELKRFKGITGGFLNNLNKIIKIQAGSGFMQGLLGEGLLCLIVYLAIAQLNMTGASVLVFLFVVSRIIPKVTVINDARIRIAEFTSGIVYLKTIFDDSLLFQKWGNVNKSTLVDGIFFDKVSFSYHNTEKFALKNISLKIKKNEKIAIVGESGAGKTTFTRLLLRLYDPTKGNIFMDGVNIADIHRDSWKRLVSVVSQDTFVFDDTIENNIKYSVENCSDELFWNAVRLARAEDFINELPEKHKTRLGERGVKLSGGQRQRVAIARAFLRDSPILILDEATSSLDSVTENLIQNALADLSENRTIIVVAHRLSTIKKADQIVVFDEGEIVEAGTHNDLIEHGVLYKQYHNLQVY